MSRRAVSQSGRRQVDLFWALCAVIVVSGGAFALGRGTRGELPLQTTNSIVRPEPSTVQSDKPKQEVASSTRTTATSCADHRELDRIFKEMIAANPQKGWKTREDVKRFFVPLREKFADDPHLLFRVILDEAYSQNPISDNWPTTAATFAEAKQLIDRIKADWCVHEMTVLSKLGGALYASGERSKALATLQKAIDIPVNDDPFGKSKRSRELLTLHYTVVRQLVNVTPIDEVHRIDGMMTFAKFHVAEEFPDKGKRLRPGMAGASKLRKQIEMMLEGTRDEIGKKTDLYEAYDRVLQDIRSKPLWHEEGVIVSNPT